MAYKSYYYFKFEIKYAILSMELIKIGFAKNIANFNWHDSGCWLLVAGKYVGVYAHHATLNEDFLFKRLRIVDTWTLNNIQIQRCHAYAYPTSS